MSVDVGVIAPVAVAALGNGNEIVTLIDAVDAARVAISCVPSAAFTASATPTTSIPRTSAVTNARSITRSITTTIR